MASSQQQEQRSPKRPATASEKQARQLILAFLDTWGIKALLGGKFISGDGIPGLQSSRRYGRFRGKWLARSEGVKDVSYATGETMPPIEIGPYEDRSQAALWNELCECFNFLFYMAGYWSTPETQDHRPYASMVLAFTEESQPHVIEAVRELIESRIEDADELEDEDARELFEGHLRMWDAAFKKDGRVQKFAEIFTCKRKADSEPPRDASSPPPSKLARVDEEQQE